MYNKLFTKILDSSIWLEETATRLVWVTMLAAMDEEGTCTFASVANLAHRARVSLPEAVAAVERLEGPDEHSSDPEHEGRRIERIPGGWVVLNAEKYRLLVTREVSKEKTRERVARHREKKRSACNAGNADVTPMKRSVTPSEAVTDADADTKTEAEPPPGGRGAGIKEGTDSKAIPTTDQSKRIAAIFHRKLTTPWTAKEIKAYRAIGTVTPEDLVAVEEYYATNWPPNRETNILRHDLVTFLNNFSGEVDRALAAKNRPAGKGAVDNSKW